MSEAETSAVDAPGARSTGIGRRTRRESSRSSALPRATLLVLGGLLFVYLVGPVIAFVARLAGAQAPGFGASGLGAALGVSALAATVSVVVIAVLGVPLAYSLARSRGRVAGLIGLAVQLPLAIPPLMAGILLIYLVGPYTPLGSFFHGALTESLAGVVLAQSFVAAPFLIVVVRATIATIPDELFDVAATLGHGEFGKFFRVALPVSRDGIYAGVLLAWLRAFGEYGATSVVAYHPYSLPIFTSLQFQASGLGLTMAPTALALLVAAAVVVLARLPLRMRAGRLPTGSCSRPTFEAAGPLSFSVAHRAGSFSLELSYRAGAHRLAILGPSGSGKSMTLRSIAGLLGADSASVRLGSDELGGRPAGERRVGYLPQHSALLPHLPVWRQVCFGVGTDLSVARHWIERLGLSDLAARRVDGLSGGQRQRVALARALARCPRLLLLDEPFSALDRAVRTELQHELRTLQRETGLSSIVVTHDFEEAALLADEVLVIAEGRLVQRGTPEELYRSPASRLVAELVGLENVREAIIDEDGQLAVDGVSVGLGPFAPQGAVALFAISPEQVRLDDGAHVAAVVDRFFRAGGEYAVVTIDCLRLVARVPEGRILDVGAKVRVDLSAAFVRVGAAEEPMAP